MKIGIIAPSPVPFVIGGAENLWAGMLAAFNQRAGIECELIKLPSPERHLVEVISSYRRFAQLDLNHFDLLISTKYPAWAVRHPNHTVYVQHKLRGLYDTYSAHLSTQINQAVLKKAGVPRELWSLLIEPDQPPQHNADSRFSTLDIAQVATQLLDVVQHADPALVAFPGPLSRASIHLLDRIALQPSRIKRYAAISRTVAERAGYFPEGVNVEVMHHPSSLDVAAASIVHTLNESNQVGAIFSASRLDGPKRIDMIVKAWLQAGIQRPLRIAGDGPERARLQQLADGNPAIQFLGRLTDAALAQEYARSAWVVFVPDQEDYGLITVEAMAARKPVLTVADAGGVTELVEHDMNGFIVAPSVEALAQGMRQLDADAALRERMGDAAAMRVANLTWPGLTQFLLNTSAPGVMPSAPAVLKGARPRYVVVNTFQLTPVTSGGRSRTKLARLHRGRAQLTARSECLRGRSSCSAVPQYLARVGEGDYTKYTQCRCRYLLTPLRVSGGL